MSSRVVKPANLEAMEKFIKIHDELMKPTIDTLNKSDLTGTYRSKSITRNLYNNNNNTSDL